MDKNFFSKTALLAFILSILVLGGHLSVDIFYKLDDSSPIDKFWIIQIDFLRNCISKIGVPFFFLKAGLLIFKNLSASEFPNKIRRRIFSLLVPYCSWNFLCWLFMAILFSLPFLSKYCVSRTFSFDFQTFLSSIFLFEYNMVNWFVLVLMIFSLTSIIFLPIVKNKYVGLGLILILFLQINPIYDFFSKICTPYGEYTIRMLPFYLLGGVIAIHYQQHLSKIYTRTTVFISWIAFILTAILYYYVKVKYSIIITPLVIAEIIFIWIGLSRIEIKHKWWFDSSFIIYESQTIVASTILKLLLITFPKNCFFMVFNFYATCILSALFCIAFYFILQKFPLSCKILNGR
jgi:hypothetical protein